MKSLLLFLLILVSFTKASAQNVTLNQKDSAGRENGRWVWYYNQYCHLVKDSNKATYYCYVDYTHGRRHVTKSDWGKKGWRLSDSANGPQTGRIKLLDGKYTSYDAKGALQDVRYYNKGTLVLDKWYSSSGVIRMVIDYSKEYRNQLHSGYLYQYNKNGAVKDTVPIYIFPDKKGKYWGGMI